MSRNGWEYESSNAQIYVGNKLCGKIPAEVRKSKVYTFNCQEVGDYIKIVTGRNNSDQKLSFSYVYVYKIVTNTHWKEIKEVVARRVDCTDIPHQLWIVL